MIFEGEFKDGKRYNGIGYNNISQFDYINGNIEGKVVTYDYEKHELFEGEYKDGEKYNGKLRTYFDSINYELKGEFEIKNGKYDGNGILYYEFFGYIKYIGEFKDGMKEGFGKEYDKQGNIIYQGKYVKGKKIY